MTKAEAKKAQAGRKCAKTLEAATKALWDFHRTAMACGDPHKEDDTRVLLAERCAEYAAFLDRFYGSEATA